jgi:hypothetical protein
MKLPRIFLITITAPAHKKSICRYLHTFLLLNLIARTYSMRGEINGRRSDDDGLE